MCRPAVSVLALSRGPVCRVPVPPAGGPLGRRSFDQPPPVLSRGPSGLLGDRLGCADSVCCRVSRDGPSLPKPNRECPVPRPAPRSSSALRAESSPVRAPGSRGRSCRSSPAAGPPHGSAPARWTPPLRWCCPPCGRRTCRAGTSSVRSAVPRRASSAVPFLPRRRVPGAGRSGAPFRPAPNRA